MKTMKWMIGFLAYMSFTISTVAATPSASDTQSVQVGRIYHMDGELLRYVPDTNDWVAVVKDAPFGVEDTLFSGNKGMAEMIAPNGSWIRIGNNTQIQFMALDSDLTEIDVASGTGRFYNKGTDTVIKVTSPFGYVLADPGTTFDFYVGDNSVEVVALKGTVNFIHPSGNARYGVTAGSPSILADQEKVSSGDGTTDPVWNRWNDNRDNVWAAKSDPKGRSVEYLPPSLRYEADCLDENGRWERLPYEGRECWFWRPTAVAVGWSPFTVGVWTEWCGDQTWIPGEPFGYVTHHYGNWVFIGNMWYWAPPVVSARIGLPLLDIGFFWYPGRVSWIHRGIYVGWVPLAPRETYYSHHNWGGPHHGVVADQAINHMDVNVRNYTYVNHAIIVNRNDFHGVDNYRNVRIGNVHQAIINKYQSAPIVNNRVIDNYESSKQRYNYGSVTAKEKPHNTVLNRIKQNETTIRQAGKENGETIRQQVNTVKEGRVLKNARVETPRAANYLVPAGDVNRPRSEIKVQQREIKKQQDPGQAVSAGGVVKSGKQSGQATGQSGQPKGATTSNSGDMLKPAVQPERVAIPEKQGQQEKSSAQQGQTTIKSGQTEKSPVKSDSTTPSKSNEIKKPAVQPDRILLPTTPGQQETSPAQQGQTTSSRSDREGRTVTQPKVVTPAVPNVPETPSVQSNRGVATPVQPGAPAGPSGQLVEIKSSGTTTQKGTDKTRDVTGSGSATQKGKVLQKATKKKADESDNQSESGARENQGQ